MKHTYDSFKLNKDLLAYYPHPEFGGNPRQNNVVISGAKFEEVDYHDIFSELAKVGTEKNYDDLYECIFNVMLRPHVELSINL